MMAVTKMFTSAISKKKTQPSEEERGQLGRWLWSELHACTRRSLAEKAFLLDFVSLVRSQCAASLDGIELL